ncbi:MAG: hypothetical protein J6U21_14135 [Bacteroidales bacterium]|nr:hypothetical protein [Bacteroidales bacterium]
MKVFLDTIHRPEQTIRLRSTLNTILSIVTSVGITHKRLVQGGNDANFDDIEDSFQYQSALQSKCDALVTINLRDFENVDAGKIEIMSPTEFVNKYL